MKIGIDARFYQESGIGRYLRNLISSLQILDKKNQYFILLLSKDFESFNTTSNFQKILAPFKWYGFAEQFKLPGILNQLNLDLVHFPHFNVPVFYKGKFVVTIHDLIHQHQVMNRATTLDPLTFKIKQFGYRRVFKYAVKSSMQILVPSNFVKKGLMEEWNISTNKVHVTYEAVDEGLLRVPSKISKEGSVGILHKFHIKPPFIFYVGNAHPHKNIKGLIRVFKELKEKYKYLQLVLAGYDHYFWERIKKEMDSRLRGNDGGVGNIIFTGEITDEELVVLFKNAKCFVLPSFEEGFGIPILEAMALSCPVVSSNAGTLKEVGGDAAIYFDPNNIADMEEKLDGILKDNKLRIQLIKKGLKRYKQFSWGKLAKQTLEVYLGCA